jgi:hypothetical protein
MKREIIIQVCLFEGCEETAPFGYTPTGKWACGDHRHLLTRASPAQPLQPKASPSAADLFGKKG